MRLLVAAVYDNAVKAFMQPFYVRTKSEAVRSFTDAVGSKDQNFCKHPEDFLLFALGEFDDQSGAIESYQAPEKIITALECVQDASSS